MRDILHDTLSGETPPEPRTPAEQAEDLAWRTAKEICDGNPVELKKLINSDRGNLLFLLAGKISQESGLNGNTVPELQKRFQDAIDRNQIPSWIKGETI